MRDDMVRVRSLHPQETKTKPLPLHAPEAFSVHDSTIEHGCNREVLQKLSWTTAEKSDPEHYSLGLTIQINAHVKGFSLGEQLEVVRVSNDTVKVQNSKGQNKVLPLDYPDAFSVHEKETIEICEGELIRITGNGRTADRHRLYTGSDYKMDHITHDGVIVLDNGWRLDENFKHFEYGYTATSHAAQGRTFDRIFIAQSEMSRGASDMKQFLVSLSRGSKGVKIYTHDIDALRDYVSRERESLMASELFRSEPELESRELADASTRLGTLEKLPMEIASDEVAGMPEYSSAALGAIELGHLSEQGVKSKPGLEYEPECKSPIREELELEMDL